MGDNTTVCPRDTDARRREIEVHIEAHRDAAAGNLLEVGRWLNAAKDEGLVPHGEWTAWVAEHAALGERTAQLWMQAARELPEGSSLAALGTAKLRSLMALPADEREAFAARIGADRLTSREVDAQVKAARAERDEALRLVGEQKKRLAEMDRERDEQVCALRRTVEKERNAVTRLQHRIEQEREDRSSVEQALRQEADTLRADMLKNEAERVALMHQLQESGMTQAAEDEIHRLERLVEDMNRQRAEAEKEIDRLSEALDEAQTAAMRTGMTGENERTSPVTLILSAIGALMTQAGRAPAELARMQGMDEETRTLLAGQARMAGQWAIQVLSACGEGDVHA